jgi:transcriptional regulator with XRE-family HTH domain
MGAREEAAFGIRLRGYRQLAGLSQEELAERAGLTTKAISALERGERTPARSERSRPPWGFPTRTALR